MISWNIPKTITQSDRITFFQQLNDYNPATDTLSCFIRGQAPLDLTGIPTGSGWDFTIESVQSKMLIPGKYKTQFVVFEFGINKKTLKTLDLLVLPSLENLTELETRSADEIELELIITAIAKLASGAVAEYRIGDRMMRYQDIGQLSRRLEYLRRRVAIAQRKLKPGGQNIGIRFGS